MSATIITRNQVKIEIHIVWDGHFYFYNRHENRQIIIDAKPISSERAANIIKLNSTDPAVNVSSRGAVEIGSKHNWSWMATIIRDDNSEAV